MAKPCAVFWDIQNVGVPKGQSVNSIIELIRSTIIKPHNLDEIFFFCVCDVQKLPSNVGNSLKNLDVDIVQAYNEVKDSADIKILDLMRKFVKVAGQDCTIILLSGDGDYCGTLSDLKRLHNVSIHLIRLANSFSPKLDQISNYTFMLTDGVLKPIKATGNPMYFISVKNYPLTMDINFVMTTLNGQIAGSIQKSASLFGDSICIGFPTLWNAEKAIEQFNGSRFYGHFLKAESLLDSPLTEILKCIKPNVTMQTKGDDEVKQLTFIKMSYSNETDISKTIKFCMACTAQSGSQCILSRKPFLWIVFSFKSDAQDCLSKVQIMYPDAIIADPPVDLTSKYHESSYTVESCEQKVSKEASSQVDNAVKPNSAKDVQVTSQNQSSTNINHPNIDPLADIKSKSSKESVDLKKTTNAKPRNALNPNESCKKIVKNAVSKNIPTLNVRDVNNLKMFFRYDNNISHVLDCQPTKWSLLYNLFEKLYDLGAKKVICDGDLYCAHFDSMSDYRDAFEKMRSRHLEPLEFVNVSESRKLKVTIKMNRYPFEIPWCFNKELDLHCLLVNVDCMHAASFTELCQNILGNRDCIFSRFCNNQFWIGFPDEITCKNSKKTVLRLLASLKLSSNVSMAKPSNKLLESINFGDLIGDAHDLKFLSKQLESLKKVTRPFIIDRITLTRIYQEHGGFEDISHITVNGNFRCCSPWIQLSLEQIVKIVVKLCKVIPLAATASYDEVKLIFNSWYEALAASHFINHLTSFEVPYFPEFNGASDVQQQPLSFSSNSKYYAINDNRNVLEKIVQNNILEGRLTWYSSKAESTPDIDVLDEKVAKKLQYLFIISTDSEFKFTSGMISVIEMHLVQMGCSVCIEFQDKIWVAFYDLEKGTKAKTDIEQIKFKMLHEKDEDDFVVGVIMQSVPSSPTEVAKMLAIKLVKPKIILNMQKHRYVEPLGHFNYNYRKAVGMSTCRYCQLSALAWA
uniref:NYN domain-containing protein n=1 Tax=Tetranychus urticae TaxID=32264 RepID=T1KGG6_TETUR